MTDPNTALTSRSDGNAPGLISSALGTLFLALLLFAFASFVRHPYARLAALTLFVVALANVGFRLFQAARQRAGRPDLGARTES